MTNNAKTFATQCAASGARAIDTKRSPIDGWRISIDAPRGQRWAGEDTHTIVAMGASINDARADAIERMRHGVTPCADAACDFCADDDAETTTPSFETQTRWTIAEIAERNTACGFYFFSPATMRSFGDTLRSFVVRTVGETIYIVRVRRPSHAPHPHIPMTEWRRFDPATGRIYDPLVCGVCRARVTAEASCSCVDHETINGGAR